jgi:hypothetical protein
MKRWGKVILAVGLGGALLAVVGCGSETRDIVVAADEVFSVLKVADDVHIPASDIKRAADSASVSAATWSDTAKSIAESPPWKTITYKFGWIDLGMGEATRELALKTACQTLALQSLGLHPNLTKILESNLHEMPGPKINEALSAANDAYTVLYGDQADGDEKDEAAVSAGCYIVNVEWDLATHHL